MAPLLRYSRSAYPGPAEPKTHVLAWRHKVSGRLGRSAPRSHSDALAVLERVSQVPSEYDEWVEAA